MLSLFTRRCTRKIQYSSFFRYNHNQVGQSIESQDAAAYCMLQTKRYDRENYVAALYIKDPLLRRAVFALRALNVELSLIRDQTTNSDRAKIRFNFWSKLVDEIIKRDSEPLPDLDKSLAYYKFSPLAKELLDLFHLLDFNELTIEKLRNLIGARISSKVLGYRDFETLDELIVYCDKSNSSVYYLFIEFSLQLKSTFQSSNDVFTRITEATKLIGVAHGLSNIIRGIKYNADKNCCYIPTEVLSKFNLTKRDILVGNSQQIDYDKISPAVQYLAQQCQQHLTEGFFKLRFFQNYFRILLLPRVAIQANLNRLQECNYNINDTRLLQKDNLLPLKMWLSSKYFRLPYNMRT